MYIFILNFIFFYKNLNFKDSNKDALNSEIISKYKGVELILTAMKRFPYHISLQTTGNHEKNN